MMLNDREIAARVQASGMISPFSGSLTTCDAEGRGCLSHGLSCAGYDALLGRDFAVPKSGVILDPKADPETQWDRFSVGPGERITLYPGEFVLGHTVEVFRMPDDLAADCVGKSTYARCGLSVLVTPIEPEWEGQVTLELANVGHRPIRFYAGEGVCQFRFWKIERPMVSYRQRGERGGKYMGQRGVVLPRVG